MHFINLPAACLPRVGTRSSTQGGRGGLKPARLLLASVSCPSFLSAPSGGNARLAAPIICFPYSFSLSILPLLVFNFDSEGWPT